MLSVGLEPAFFRFLQTGAYHLFMEEKFPVLFHCFCLYKTGWGYYGKTYALTFKMGISHENISLWKCFPKYIFFHFSVSFCIRSQPLLWWVYMTITDCDSFLLCFFLTFCILFNSRSYFSGEGNVTWSSKQSPLRLEGVIITENSTVVWISQTCKGSLLFPKKGNEKPDIFPPAIFHFEHEFIWISIQKQSMRSPNQAILNNEAPVNHLELNPWCSSQPCKRGWGELGTLSHSCHCLWV